MSALANASTKSFPVITFYFFMHWWFGVKLYLMHTGGRGGKVDPLVWGDVPFWTKFATPRQAHCVHEMKYCNRADVIAQKEAEYAAANPGKPGSDFWLPPPGEPDKIEPEKFLV